MDSLKATLVAQPAARPGAAIRRREILGIPMSMTDYAGAMDVMDDMIERRERGWICAAAVHSVMVAQDDPTMRTALTQSTITVPDGMPIVWAANLLGEELPNRVYGPELMRRYCARSAERGHRVWLYGGRDQGTLVQLALNLRKAHPGIQIVGGHSPPFRPLSEEEDSAILVPDRGRPARRDLGGDRGAQAGEVDGPHARPRRGAGHVRGGRRVRLPRRSRVPGAAVDAGARARVDLPDRPGAAPAAAALPLHQSPLLARLRAPVPLAPSSRPRAHH